MRTIQGIEKWLRNRAQLKLIKTMIQEVKRNTQKTKDYQNKTGRNQTYQTKTWQDTGKVYAAEAINTTLKDKHNQLRNLGTIYKH